MFLKNILAIKFMDTLLKLLLKLKVVQIKKSGFVIDFQDIEDSFEPLRKLLDHAYLNDIKGLENPTSENMCLYIWENIKPSLPGIIEVEIKETSAAGCKY